MLEKIPDYNPNLLNIPTAKTSSPVDLPPITFRPSRYLWLAECVLYSAMFVFATIALIPFFLSAFYWPVSWLLFSLLIVAVLRNRWRVVNAAPISLHIKHNKWILRRHNTDYAVEPFGDVLLWSWVIILPVQEQITSRKHYLIALPDSLDADDWRKLCVWLRLRFSKE